MIILIGSRHDEVARSLTSALPRASLCGADDLTRPGWLWSLASPEEPRWVVAGEVVPDTQVSGVLLRRTCVYPEELVDTHRDDRAYLAAEATAFLIFVLSRTRATVVNSVEDGALGEDAIRAERWMRRAGELGVAISPLRLQAGPPIARPSPGATVEVVQDLAFGDAPAGMRRVAVHLAHDLGLLYGAFVFDGDARLVTVSTMYRPSDEATLHLGRLLAAGRAAGHVARRG